MDISRTHYITATERGSICCDHVWMTEKRNSVLGKNVISRSCVKCPRFERWISLARPRPARNF